MSKRKFTLSIKRKKKKKNHEYLTSQKRKPPLLQVKNFAKFGQIQKIY